MGIHASVAISMTCLPGAKDTMDVASLWSYPKLAIKL